jgi:hypothetical protein
MISTSILYEKYTIAGALLSVSKFGKKFFRNSLFHAVTSNEVQTLLALSRQKLEMQGFS